jgi:DNA repair protein RadC
LDRTSNIGLSSGKPHTDTVVDPKVVLGVVLKCNAHGITLCHNHPSGNLKPNEADISLTKKIKDGGILLDILVLDHIILTSENYYSLADEGLL